MKDEKAGWTLREWTMVEDIAEVDIAGAHNESCFDAGI